jgi:dUTPase
MRVLRLHPDVLLPTIARPGEDNAYDLYLPADVVLQPNTPTIIPLGITAAQKGCGFLIIGRSTAFKRGVIVTPSLVDAGYRGEWHVFVTSASGYLLLRSGERIAQAVPIPNLTLPITETYLAEAFNPSLRGDRGLGSSGT